MSNVVSNQTDTITEESVPALQRGDRIRMTEKSFAFEGLCGTVTNTEVTPGYIAVWLDGDWMERWPPVEDVAFVERPMRPMIYAPEDVAKELQAGEAKIWAAAGLQAGERS